MIFGSKGETDVMLHQMAGSVAKSMIILILYILPNCLVESGSRPELGK